MKSIHDPRYVETISRLKSARELKGISQLHLSQRLGKPQSYISKIEIGERRIDLIEVLDLCKVLGISIADIIPSGMKYLLCVKDAQENDR